MNRQRRNLIRGYVRELARIRECLAFLQEAEEEARDNLPEAMQDGAQYEAMDEAAGHLQEAVDAIDQAMDELEDAKA